MNEQYIERVKRGLEDDYRNSTVFESLSIKSKRVEVSNKSYFTLLDNDNKAMSLQDISEYTGVSVNQLKVLLNAVTCTPVTDSMKDDIKNISIEPKKSLLFNTIQDIDTLLTLIEDRYISKIFIAVQYS